MYFQNVGFLTLSVLALFGWTLLVWWLTGRHARMRGAQPLAPPPPPAADAVPPSRGPSPPRRGVHPPPVPLPVLNPLPSHRGWFRWFGALCGCGGRGGGEAALEARVRGTEARIEEMATLLRAVGPRFGVPGSPHVAPGDYDLVPGRDNSGGAMRALPMTTKVVGVDGCRRAPTTNDAPLWRDGPLPGTSPSSPPLSSLQGILCLTWVTARWRPQVAQRQAGHQRSCRGQRGPRQRRRRVDV